MTEGYLQMPGPEKKTNPDPTVHLVTLYDN